jgi:hypothetical protein
MARCSYSELKDNNELYEGEIKGIPCMYTDERVNPDTVPNGKYVYEVAGDDDCGDTPVRVSPGVSVNFYATVILDQPLELDEENDLWLNDGDYQLF